jgi:hypothetical protein
MGEHAWTIWSRVRDVVDCRATRWVQGCSRANPLGNFVIGARRVAADAKPADDFSLTIKRHSAAKKDQAAGDLLTTAAIAVRWCVEFRIPQI